MALMTRDQHARLMSSNEIVRVLRLLSSQRVRHRTLSLQGIAALTTFTDEHRATQAAVRGQIWDFYADLKAYRLAPTPESKAALQARFDGIFTQKTGFTTLDRLLKRLHANKSELLMVLERPEIPVHTNGSENDIRCHVTRRKVSGGTRSDRGRDCRDAFLGLAKTCAKLAISFRDYLGDRLAVPGAKVVPQLSELVLAKTGR